MTTILLITTLVLLAVIGLLSFLLFSVFKVMSEFNPSKSLSMQELKEPIKALNKISDIDREAYKNITHTAAFHYIDSHPAHCQQYLKEHHFFAVTTEFNEQ